MKAIEVVTNLIAMACRVQENTGTPANTLRMHPATRNRVAQAFRVVTVSGLLAAFVRRERKRTNRRRRAERIRRYGR